MAAVDGEAFTFQFGPAAAVQQDLATTQQQINMAIANLDQYSNQQLQFWTSEARNIYNGVKHLWDEAAREMTQILGTIHVGLGGVHDNFRATENQVAGMW